MPLAPGACKPFKLADMTHCPSWHTRLKQYAAIAALTVGFSAYLHQEQLVDPVSCHHWASAH